MKEALIRTQEGISTKSSEKGATLVEFTLVFPIFIFLLFAIIGFSQIISQRVILADALRTTGRAASVADPAEFVNAGVFASSFQDTFMEYLRTHKVPGQLAVKQASIDAEAPVTGIVSVKNDKYGVTLNVNADVQCDFFCSLALHGLSLFRGDKATWTLRSTQFFPFENQEQWKTAGWVTHENT